MRSKILLALLVLCAFSANAATDTNAFTLSKVRAGGTDLVIIKTLSDNFVSTPDLFFRGVGDTITTIKTDSNLGGGEFSEAMGFAAKRSGEISGMAYESRAFSWTGVTEVRSSIIGSVTTGTCYPEYNPSYQNGVVESRSAGATIANVGTKEYEIYLTGGHNTVTNNIPIRETEINPTTYKVEFSLLPLDMDTPAEVFNQAIDFGFSVDSGKELYYGYSFYRELGLGDTTCRSAMDYTRRTEVS
jgi:hypothetical protein